MRLDLVFGARPQMWVVLSRRNLVSLLAGISERGEAWSIRSGNARRIVEGNPTPAPDWHLSVFADPDNHDEGATLRMASAPGAAGHGRAFVGIGPDTLRVLLDELDNPAGRRDYAVPAVGSQFGWQVGIHLEDDEVHYAGRTPGDVSHNPDAPR